MILTNILGPRYKYRPDGDIAIIARPVERAAEATLGNSSVFYQSTCARRPKVLMLFAPSVPLEETLKASFTLEWE